MRVSEYTNCARKGNPSYNIYSNAVNLTPRGVSVHFFSDKVTSASTSPKHRRRSWAQLPPIVHQVLEEFKNK